MPWTFDGGWQAARDRVPGGGCRRRARAVPDIAGSARQSGAGQPAERRHTAPSARKRWPLGLLRGSHPAGTAVPCVKGLLQECPWRFESPLVTPHSPQEGLFRSPDAGLRSSEGHSAADSVDPATGGPLRHAPKRSVRPQRTRLRLRSLGPASAQAVRFAPTKRSERGRSGVLVAFPSALKS